MKSGRPVWRPRAWIVAIAVVAVLLLVAATIGLEPPLLQGLAVGAFLLATAAAVTWALWRTRRERRRFEEQLADWAAERAATAERLRIARELHDLASHGLGVITLRSAAARAVTGPDADTERASALADIEAASRATTEELRSMLRVLRAPDPAPLRPADTIEALPGIVQTARDAGLTVRSTIDELGALDPAVQLAICAVAREALHNALRHAGPTTVDLSVRRVADTVTVAVHDDGPQGPHTPIVGAGAGLVGLRERVGAHGGSLEVGPRGDGWSLVARLQVTA